MASTNKTENLQLNQWVRTDPVLMDDMNADNAKIDEAVKALQDAMPRMAWGSYVGTGNCGPGAPTVLSFDFPPRLVFVRGSSIYSGGMNYACVFIYPAASALCEGEGATNAIQKIFWNGNTLLWYCTYASDTDNQKYQLNYKGETYHYFALG